MDASTEEQLMKNYEVVRVLGQGSFGRVFLIRNIKTNAQYAMKKYSYYHLKKNGKDLSLQRSVKILQSLSHKAILKIVKYIITKEDSIYLFFQACKKGSLEGLKSLIIKANERPLVDLVLFQLIQGLRYLKQSSVAHRDLKPSNIAFTSRGQLKIIDFDEAVCFNPSYIKTESRRLPDFPEVSQCPIYVSRRSRAMSYVGTQTYMSPQMKCKTQSDERGDIWALGCIIYEMLMNESFLVDFQEDNQMSQDIAQKMAEMRKHEIPEDYVVLLEKILTINPNQRASIEQIYADKMFSTFRDDSIALEKTQTRFKKLLRGNFSIPNPKTLYDALSVDLIGMKAGQELFQKLKTVVLVNKKHSYDILHLIGGGRYLKFKQVDDQNQKYYVYYDEIQKIQIEGAFIVIQVVVEKWSHSSSKTDRKILIKHIYQDQKILGKLFDLLVRVYND